MAKKLADWNRDKPRQEAVKRMKAQLAAVCAKLPADDPARKSCDGLWNAPKGAAA